MVTPAQDPAYLAYLRAMGFETAEDQRATAQQVGRARDRQAFQTGRVQQQGLLEREQVSGSFEDRGLHRSGDHEVGLARQRADEQYEVGGLAMSTAETIADLEADLGRRIAGRQREVPDQALSALVKLLLGEGQAMYPNE